MTAPTVDRETERRLGIATRCEFATPGPWYTIEVEECDGAVCITHAHHDLYRVEAEANITAQMPGFTAAVMSHREVNVGCFLGERADAEFIACARADVEWLLDRLKDSDAALLAARREVEALRAALEQILLLHALEGAEMKAIASAALAATPEEK